MTFSHVSRGLLVVALLLAVGVPSALAQANAGRMSGRVLDEEREPLASVAILAEAPDRNGVVQRIEATSDDNGRFTAIGFTSGQWRVAATLDGYEVSPLVVQVRQTGVAEASFTMTRVLSAFERMIGEEGLEGLDADALEADLKGADSALDAQEFDQAIAAYNKLLEQLPHFTFIHLNVGNAHRGKGDYEAALASYEQLVGDPDRGQQAEVEIARTRLAMGDLDAAAGLVNAGADATREDLYNLGEVDFARGDVDAAAGWYEKATMVDPNWEKPWFKLALVALNKGDMEAAKQNFQKVVDIAPNSEDGAQAQATLSALP